MLELRNKMMGLMGVPNPNGQATTLEEVTQDPLGQEPDTPDKAYSFSSNTSDTSNKEKPKPKRSRQTRGSSTLTSAQPPINVKFRPVKPSQPHGSKEKREPLRERRPTTHNAIIRSPTRSPQKNAIEWNQLQRGFGNVENAGFSDFEDLNKVVFEETQVLMGTQAYRQSIMGPSSANEIDLEATI